MLKTGDRVKIVDNPFGGQHVGQTGVVDGRVNQGVVTLHLDDGTDMAMFEDCLRKLRKAS